MKGCRHEVPLATKPPVWAVEQESSRERFIARQLAQLDVGRIDFSTASTGNST